MKLALEKLKLYISFQKYTKKWDLLGSKTNLEYYLFISADSWLPSEIVFLITWRIRCTNMHPSIVFKYSLASSKQTLERKKKIWGCSVAYMWLVLACLKIVFFLRHAWIHLTGFNWYTEICLLTYSQLAQLCHLYESPR